MTVYPLPDVMLVGSDPEYLDTGFYNYHHPITTTTNNNNGGETVGMGGSSGDGSGCCVISPVSKPSQNE